MAEIGQLMELWRYPVSSLAGEALAEAAVGAAGLRGDRTWGAVDARSGEIARPGKQPRWDATPQVAARFAGAGVEVFIAEGEGAQRAWLTGESDAARAALSAHFGFPVELRRHPAPGVPSEAPTVVPRYQLRHIHLLSTASVDAIRRLLPQSLIDARRFRPNLLVDLAGQPGDFPENRWPMGQEFAIGSARFKVIDPCKRCVFVTVRHGELPRDAGVLRAIAEHNGGNLGVVCAVVQPGRVRRGDAVRMG